MSIINIENLSFSHDSSDDLLFDNVSVQLDSNWRLGLIGRNGRGKTTFLNLLLGKYEYKGKIYSPLRFDYFPFEVKDKELTMIDIINQMCDDIEEWEIIRELSYLDIDEDIAYRPFKYLSSGERTKGLLVSMFLRKNNFLLIDEPTNHLDIKGREKVAQYLRKKNGFIVVSHDRTFLDICVDHILSINRANVEVQSGNFSSYMENFKRQEQYELTQNNRLKKDIVRLNKAARQTSNWSDKVEASKIGAGDKGYVGHMAAKMMKRSKNIEARQLKAIEEKKTLLKNVEEIEDLSLFSLDPHTNKLISISDLSIIYDDKEIFEPVSFDILKNERVFLDGINGSGKSSLLKLIINGDMRHSGMITKNPGIIISYVPQETSHLSGSLKKFILDNDLDEHRFKAILRKMDFERSDFTSDLSNYSAGQKKKVLLAKSLTEKAHLYIWDEPLNYIDIYSRMQIEKLIDTFKPTMLMVEHDQAFKNAICTKSINIKPFRQ